MITQNNGYGQPALPNITSLRFFLALLVVIFHIASFSEKRAFPHFDSLPVFNRGLEAVYMFFSLSGFLIIRNLFNDKKNTGKISISNFYMKRVLRIFPLYYAVLFFGLFYYNFLMPRLGIETGQMECTLTQALLLGGTFFSNILATFNPGGIIEILWSIGIEEQFYLLVAPLLFLLPLNKIWLFLAAFTLFYFALFHLRMPDFLMKYHMFFYYFSFSGLLAISNVNINAKLVKYFKLLIYTLIILYFTTNLFKSYLSYAAYQFISMVLFGVFIKLFSDKPIAFFQKSFLVYLGKISYGIYMLHAIAMHMAAFAFIKINVVSHFSNKTIFIIAFNLATIALTLFLAHCSYKYFETYFLRLKPAQNTSN